MKIGILSDAHGNAGALQKCLACLNQLEVDKLYFLGDAVGYYPLGIETLAMLRENNIYSLSGNHEAMLLGELPYSTEQEDFYRLNPIREKLTEELTGYLRSLSPEHTFEVDRKKILLMHAGPSNHLTQYVYPNSDLSVFQQLPFDIFCMGHTHHPFYRKEGNKIILNVGSCGMPRDIGTLSSFAILDTITGSADIIRIPLDAGIYQQSFKDQAHPSVFDLYKRKPEKFAGRLINTQ